MAGFGRRNEGVHWLIGTTVKVLEDTRSGALLVPGKSTKGTRDYVESSGGAGGSIISQGYGRAANWRVCGEDGSHLTGQGIDHESIYCGSANGDLN